jgi:hypothetical protein
LISIANPLGKTFMERYLKKKLPEDIARAFDDKYHFTLENILDALYNRPAPNRFLASFSEFLGPLQEHPFIHDLVFASFDAFFTEQIMKYESREVPVSFTGSVAFFYKKILLEAAEKREIRVETVSQSPLEGLIKYHT